LGLGTSTQQEELCGLLVNFGEAGKHERWSSETLKASLTLLRAAADSLSIEILKNKMKIEVHSEVLN
jgi:hypothetical protein